MYAGWMKKERLTENVNRIFQSSEFQVRGILFKIWTGFQYKKNIVMLVSVSKYG